MLSSMFVLLGKYKKEERKAVDCPFLSLLYQATSLGRDFSLNYLVEIALSRDNVIRSVIFRLNILGSLKNKVALNIIENIRVHHN